jgi:hypothetical protein
MSYPGSVMSRVVALRRGVAIARDKERDAEDATSASVNVHSYSS